GGMSEVNGRMVVSVATTEKVGSGMTLIARGTSGHGSRPRPDNPVVHLAAAVAKFGEWQPPMRLNATTREYFSRMADVVDPELADLYRNLENPERTEEVQERLRHVDITANSTIRTSISPNIIEGGFRSNVIPGEASARLDIRALPDEDITELMQAMAALIDDPAVEIVPPGRRRPVNPPMPMDSELFRALETAQAEVFPGGLTVPTMLTGATDSAQLRAAGVLTYGLGVVRGDEGSLAHGNDERVSIEGVGRFVEYLYGVVTEVAAAR
ncbi:MAG: M20/M25/M40 family metallo-hydrolase, partial [Gemmatimonadota bacterium]|nr:M20/M25/M40 family metallo-hydrolase [Gemmatimonadota bacterium]